MQALTTLLDITAVACFLILVSVIVSGGWTVNIFQIRISAHGPENPGAAVFALLLLRKLIDWRTPIHDIPLIRSIRQTLQRFAPLTEKRSLLVLAGLIIGYSVIMGAVVCMKHSAFKSHAYDLGIFSQVFWSATNGFGLHSSILDNSFLGEHFSPILYLLVPGYRLWPHPAYLLLVQTVILALAALPLFLLASSELKSRNWGLFFAFLYLCYQPMRNVNLYDFHEIAIATPLLMLAFFFLHKGRTIAFLLVLGAALACKEEIAAIIFILGVYILFVRKQRLLGPVLAFSGLAIFFALIFLVIPHFRNAPYGFVGRYSYLGQNIPAIMTTLATRPAYVLSHLLTHDKLEYVWNVFGPLGFLSFASPSHLLLTAPTLIQNLLSDCRPQYSTSFQYTSPLTPFVFISAVFGARRLLFRASQLECRRDSSLPVFLILCSLTLFGASPVSNLKEYRSTQYSRYVHEHVLPEIPPGAAVSAQEAFVPHLTQRRRLYEFPVVKDAEYVLLDSRANRWPMDESEYLRHIRDLMKTPHRIVLSNGSLLLLKLDPGSDKPGDQMPAGFIAKDEPEYSGE